MKICGIEFAPLMVPMERRLQTIAAGAWFVTMAFGSIIGGIFAIYLILFTQLRWLVIFYLLWVYLIDKNISENGSRPLNWVKNWIWWRYFRDYFPLRLERIPWVELDKNKNYLFCCFPHGMLPCGIFNAFCTNYSGFKDLFPYHETVVATLAQHFQSPFFRELVLSLGGCSASSKSITNYLRTPNGGKVVVLVPGGAAEAYYCQPGQYKLNLKNRKGFIRLALKNGSPIVPVFSFGETDLFTQFDNPQLRKIQEILRKYIGIAPILPIGRGFFQYSFGLIPKRKPVTTVVGKPINFEKIENPTQEQVDDLHGKFIEELEKLFEEQKHFYLSNPNDKHLEIY